MADRTPDVSHRDQLSVVVRYVDNEGCPVERMLSLAGAEDKSGSGLADCILQRLSDASLDDGNLAFQSYDFASTMSGKYRGVHAQISSTLKRTVPYIP